MAAGEGKGVLLQPQVPELQQVGIAQFRLTAGKRADTGQKFFGVKGLGQVVIRAPVQSLHPVGDFGAGGEHQDGHGASRFPQTAQNREAVQLGEHHVQKHHVVNAGQGVVQAGFPVVPHVRGVSVQLQKVLQGRGKPCLVFNYQYTHSASFHSASDAQAVLGHGQHGVQELAGQ